MHLLLPRVHGGDGVVPLGANVVSLELDAFEFGVGDFDFLGVVAGVESGGDFQAGFGGGAANQGQQFAESSQGFTGPVQRDETEEPMFDPIPLRGARRIVAHGDRQARLGGELLQFALPQTTARRVAAAAVGQQQQMATTGVGRLGGAPPVPQAVDGELRGVGRPSHADMSAIATDIVHSVGDGAALGVLREVMSVDLFRLGTPSCSVVGEVPHEFLVLRVDAQHRAALAQGQVSQSPQIAELPITIRWRLATEPFVIGAQSVSGTPQQTPQHAGTSALGELSGQRPQAATDPFHRLSGGRTRRFRLDGFQ